MKEEKQIEKGVEIYEKFADQFGYKYSTPTTFTAIKFYLLSKRKDLKEYLLREMLKEFLSTFSDDEIVVQEGKLFIVGIKYFKL